MKGSASRRKTVACAGIVALVATSLAATVLLFVAGPAAASGSPAARYDVINGTVNAATDHEIGGSSAFPNYETGAVDNYYSMAHADIDNSPFAEGTASPADTGPIGQTAAAGHFEQRQYADARWPGNSGKASFGNKGGPYAVAAASSYTATAAASEASQTLAGPSGFGHRLRLALRAWKSRWLAPLRLKLTAGRQLAALTVPTVTVPSVTTPSVTTPATTTPAATVPAKTTPTVTTPTVTVPRVRKPKLPTKTHRKTRTSSRTHRSKSSSPANTASLLQSSTAARLQPGGALVTGGESSLKHVVLGNGQIVIDGIHVTASVTNRGTPTQKISVDIGNASIGGVPVTIGQNGVHVAGRGQGLPYQQADDQLNAALKQAGIELFTVRPEVVRSPHEETVTATGLHVKFVQQVHQGGVPDQNVEHILGEVFVYSLAVPGSPLPKVTFGGGGGGGGSTSGSVIPPTPPTTTPPAVHTTTTRTAIPLQTTTIPGSSSTGFPSGGGSTASTSSSSGIEPTSSTTGGSASQGASALVSFVRKRPLWLLVGYLVWQALALGAGVSLRNWGMGGAS